MMRISISVPNQLFPLIAHATKFFVEHPDVMLKECKMHLDGKIHKDFSPVTCCSEIHNYMHLRPHFSVFVISKFATKGGEYELWIRVEDGVAQMQAYPLEK